MNENTNTTIQNQVVTNILVSQVEETFKSGCRFIGLNYTNENGEKSRYNLLMGIKLESLYKSDLRTCKNLLPTLSGVKQVACQELVNSLTESLTKGIGNNSQYTLKGYYQSITPNGEVKLHTDEQGNQFLYIRGYVIKKTVEVKGTYPTVKSSEKTLAKKEIDKTLKRGKLRTFKLNVNVLHTIKVNGMSIDIN
jgi:hypothetical protein